jgi:hypothetical protein
MVPVKNDDLWKRLDRAMEFHKVDCRTWRIDPAHVQQVDGDLTRKEGAAPGAESADAEPSRTAQIREKLRIWRDSLANGLSPASETTRLAGSS